MENKKEETTHFEFTKEEVSLLWQMVDVCLKSGGVKNLIPMHKIAQALQKPVIAAITKPVKTE